ncbi:MAG: hypothetical protein HY209_01230 [Candidatus Omnitrophica bacterium]|nr:hypothetical protein [Candidatus Omnitrophota bacterium]
MLKNFSFLVFILIGILSGCLQQAPETEQAQGGVRDDLLKKYDKMVSERQKEINHLANEIKHNDHSADLFYRKALLEIENNNLRDALSQCWLYKDSAGHKEEKKVYGLFSVLQDRAKGVREDMKGVILTHPDCFKIADTSELIASYQQRAMSSSYDIVQQPVRDLSRAIELGTRQKEAYLYRSQLDTESELNDYSKALSITPDAPTYIKRAILYYQKDDRLVYRDCLNAINLDPGYPDSYVLKALEEWNNSASCSNSDHSVRKACQRQVAQTILNDLKTAYAYDPSFPLLKEDIERYSKSLEEDDPEVWGFSSENY